MLYFIAVKPQDALSIFFLLVKYVRSENSKKFTKCIKDKHEQLGNNKAFMNNFSSNLLRIWSWFTCVFFVFLPNVRNVPSLQFLLNFWNLSCSWRKRCANNWDRLIWDYDIWDFFIWDHIHSRPFIRDHVHSRPHRLRPHSFGTTFIWYHIHLKPIHLVLGPLHLARNHCVKQGNCECDSHSELAHLKQFWTSRTRN